MLMLAIFSCDMLEYPVLSYRQEMRLQCVCHILWYNCTHVGRMPIASASVSPVKIIPSFYKKKLLNRKLTLQSKARINKYDLF